MKLSTFLSLSSAALPAVLAVPSASPLVSRQTPGCLNSQSRLCWDGTYDINTDYYAGGPDTGVVRTYNFEIQNTTLAPDGIARPVLAINGQIPGPTIVADWGDTIQVNLKNSMTDNGTSIHWHGFRQFANSLNDGVNGVTECALAPGDSKTYTFKATQYGTSWYHSHFSVQYGDGVVGAIQINGPATAEYDIDLGTIPLMEWYETLTEFQAGYDADHGTRVTPGNFLINGVNVNLANQTLGTRFKTAFTSGKKHRLRFINTSVDTVFRVALDNHTMTVIQSDFVPIHPYTTSAINIAIGQRYDVIIEANQASSSYWLRTLPCGSANSNAGTGTATGYITYDNVTALPTTVSTTTTTVCTDEPAASLVPYLAKDVDNSGFVTNQTAVNITGPARVTVAGGTVFRWAIYGPSMSIDYSYPSLLHISEGNTTWAPEENPIFFPDDRWIFWVIDNLTGASHPLHLHGHDFYVVSSGSGAFDSSTATMTWTNPPRRDVQTVAGNGYILLAFPADNPGVWLFHCHIAFHVAEGLSLQVVERQSEIFNDMTLTDAWKQQCTNWDAYTPYYQRLDSGL